jgi:hypothetical protein
MLAGAFVDFKTTNADWLGAYTSDDGIKYNGYAAELYNVFDLWNNK